MNKLEQMQKLLKEMFQFEESDLDFGIYRIMNIKREEVSKFIDKELVEYVKEEIKTVEDSGELKNKLDELKKQLEGIFGKDIDEIVKSYPDVEKVKEYVKEKGPEWGFNAKTGEFENLIEAGVIDPVKVTRTALQNAASVAGLLLTTEATITEIPEKEAPAMPPMDPGMGGMGGMGGMPGMM